MLKIKIRLIVLGLLIFWWLLPIYGQAAGATLYLSPSSGSYAIGESFSVAVYVNSAEQAMNAASGNISFPQNKLEVTSLSKGGSIISLWIQEPSFSNSSGTINFEGIILNPGFVGTGGKIITITFKVLGGGSASLIFSSGSVLANDGLGTSILAGMGGANFDLVEAVAPPEVPPTPVAPPVVVLVPAAPEVSSPTHPDPDKWYANNSPTFEWQLPAGVNGVSIFPTEEPTSNPGPVSDGLMNTQSYFDLEEGVWYLHIKLRNSAGWSKITHFRFQIDTQTPDYFEITEVERIDLTNPVAEFTFDAADATSGIDYYEIQIDDLETQVWHDDGNHLYKTPVLTYGEHTLLVKATDKAGNYLSDTAEFIVESIEPPTITEYPRELLASEILIVKGLTYATAQVTLWLQKESASPQSQTIISDPDGRFTFVAEKGLKRGVYEMWAEVTDERGAKSKPSEKLTITVRPPRLWDITTWPVESLITLAILLVIILLLIVLLWQNRRKLKQHRDGVSKSGINQQCINDVLHLLRTDIQNKVKLLERAKSKMPLTKKEIKFINELCKKYSGGKIAEQESRRTKRK